jgi:hypothetical protein
MSVDNLLLHDAVDGLDAKFVNKRLGTFFMSKNALMIQMLALILTMQWIKLFFAKAFKVDFCIGPMSFGNVKRSLVASVLLRGCCWVDSPCSSLSWFDQRIVLPRGKADWVGVTNKILAQLLLVRLLFSGFES